MYYQRFFLVICLVFGMRHQLMSKVYTMLSKPLKDCLASFKGLHDIFYRGLIRHSLITSLAFSLALLPQLNHAQNISTIAGTGTAGYNGDGIPAISAQFNGVQGLAFDGTGNLYAADISNHRIRKITMSTGLISTIAGTGTAGYNGDGILATTAQINTPSALAFDRNGDLYFTDRSNHRVRKITTSTGIISTVAGTGTAGYNGDGILATAAQLNGPNEVSFDASGNLYIADWFNNRVRKADNSTGIISTIAGTGTAGYNGDGIAATAAQINGPCGIIFDNAGNIYIAEYGGARVRKINIGTGNISTIAGTGTAGYNGDGIAATTAKLNFPFYIFFDQAKCNMYIADYNNNRIRLITGGFIGCTALPLNLLFFKGINKDSYNLLEWQTTSAADNNYFSIEKSIDSRNFTSIGTINTGAGNSYSFIDRHPANGINYYRVAQRSNDNSLTYSAIISISNKPTANVSINMYPNPANGLVWLTSSTMISELKISNPAGQIIYDTKPAEKELILHVDKTGIYFIQIFTTKEYITKKLIVGR